MEYITARFSMLVLANSMMQLMPHITSAVTVLHISEKMRSDVDFYVQLYSLIMVQKKVKTKQTTEVIKKSA